LRFRFSYRIVVGVCNGPPIRIAAKQVVPWIIGVLADCQTGNEQFDVFRDDVSAQSSLTLPSAERRKASDYRTADFFWWMWRSDWTWQTFD